MAKLQVAVHDDSISRFDEIADVLVRRLDFRADELVPAAPALSTDDFWEALRNKQAWIRRMNDTVSVVAMWVEKGATADREWARTDGILFPTVTPPGAAPTVRTSADETGTAEPTLRVFGLCRLGCVTGSSRTVVLRVRLPSVGSRPFTGVPWSSSWR